MRGQEEKEDGRKQEEEKNDVKNEAWELIANVLREGFL